PARRRMVMSGMNIQASIASMLSRAIHGDAKNAGVSQPSQRAKLDNGPKRNSIIDLPIIQLTAIGLSMKGMRKAMRKKRLARISLLRSRASPKAMAYSIAMAAM